MAELCISVCNIDRLRFGIDGQGVRTLVIVKDCPLRCAYCLNRYAWQDYVKSKVMTVSELYDAVKIDDLYYQATCGGITFGGGEPLLYAYFIREFIKEYRRCGWNFVIETSLCVDCEFVAALVDYVDFWYVDVKMLNPFIYERYTGGNFYMMYKNLLFLKETAVGKIVVRVPYVPKYIYKQEQQQYSHQLRELGFQVEEFDYVIK